MYGKICWENGCLGDGLGSSDLLYVTHMLWFHGAVYYHYDGIYILVSSACWQCEVHGLRVLRWVLRFLMIISWLGFTQSFKVSSLMTQRSAWFMVVNVWNWILLQINILLPWFGSDYSSACKALGQTALASNYRTCTYGCALLGLIFSEPLYNFCEMVIISIIIL